VTLTEQERAARMQRGREEAERLAAGGVCGVAVTFVDNSGIARVKSVPVARLEQAAGWGVGATPAFDVFVVDDSITTSPQIGGPDGDLRLLPDLGRLTPLAAQPGWAWAPADRYSQDGGVWAGCQRSFARRLAAAAADRGLELRMAFELEFALSHAGGGEFQAAVGGPAYGMTRLIEQSAFGRDLLEALRQQGVVVEQFHPEYAPGQFELSVAPQDPLGAADWSVLARATIRVLAHSHGLQVSFAPVAVAGAVGNGGHVHWSVWEGGRNLYAGGEGPYGMTAAGESFAAGVLGCLPALVAIGAPSVASYLRLVPSHWAGVYQSWGRETRENALRLVTGSRGSEPQAANFETKCFDLSANPYLLVGSLIAAGLAGLDGGVRLPAETTGDPAARSQAELASLGVERLPRSLEEALGHLEASQVLGDALGSALLGAFVAVRRAELAAFADATPQEIVAATRWRH
jgi:glutamine synthetase